jgi:NAD(P)-dependent dehydrogenase (short-subunit alcohol dehydrogenase family)
MFLTKECCLTFLANPLGDLERRAIAGTSRPQPIAIVNIQANAVLPGWIGTDHTRRARQEIDGLHDKVLGRTPAARWGAIADFAGIAVFLSSAA